MSTSERLTEFAWAEYEHLDTRTLNIFGSVVRQITSVLSYLEITAAEYDGASAAFFENLEQQQAAFERNGPGEHEVTEEERALMEEGALAAILVHLRIETFYLFAKILLDRLARLLPHYFGSARGVKVKGHSSLVSGALPKFSAGLGLTEVPASLSSRIQDLGRRVSDYRDQAIAHAYSPRTMRATMFERDSMRASISTATLYPRDDSEMAINSENPRTLLPTIEEYVLELLDYIEANREKAWTPRSATAPV